MKNYYITTNDEKIEIIDKEEINLSGCNFETNKKIKEIYISDLPRCKTLFLQYNCLTKFKADLPNCESLYLYDNCLTSFKANLPNCESLYLGYNNLKSFNVDLPNTELLYLSHKSLLYKRINNKSTFYI